MNRCVDQTYYPKGHRYFQPSLGTESSLNASKTGFCVLTYLPNIASLPMNCANFGVHDSFSIHCRAGFQCPADDESLLDLQQLHIVDHFDKRRVFILSGGNKVTLFMITQACAAGNVI